MAVWQVHEAKARFSEVVEKANTNGPQIITRHGFERAVVLSAADYHALTAQKPAFRDYLLSGPKVESFDVRRVRDTGRKIVL